MRVISLTLAAVVMSVSVPALAQQRQQSEFDRAVERAGREARERADREAADRADREARADRAANNVGHEGRLGVSDGVSVGGRVRDGGAEVNVRVDYDPK